MTENKKGGLPPTENQDKDNHFLTPCKTIIESLKERPKTTLKVAKNGIENDYAVQEEISAVEADKQPAPIYLSAVVTLMDDILEYVPIIEINGKIIFSRGNISTISGAAKSRKTFLTVLFTAQYLGINPNGKALVVDTEQGREHVKKSLERIYKIMEWDTQTNSEQLTVLSLREYPYKERAEILENAICNIRPDLIFLDGVKDMVANINDPVESSEIVSLLMRLSTVHDCHICSVIHENKSDNKLRGHLGTELNNKSETVLRVVKKDDSISSVSPELTRNLPFDNFSFRIDDDGLPQFCEQLANLAENSKSAIDKTEEMRQMFDVILSDSAMSHTELWNSIAELEEVSEATAKRRIDTAVNTKIIFKGEDGKYYYQKAVPVEDIEPLAEEETLPAEKRMTGMD